MMAIEAKSLTETRIALLPTERVTRESHGLPQLLRKYRAGEELYPGQLTKILHLLPQKDREPLRAEIKSTNNRFWSEWAEWRCSPPGHGESNFEDFMRLLGVRKRFLEKSVDPQQGELFVDLFSGTGIALQELTRRQRERIAGYVAIDFNPQITPFTQKQVEKLKPGKSFVLTHDLSFGLPPQLQGIIETIKPDRVRNVGCWGATYLPADELLNLVHESLDGKHLVRLTGEKTPATLDILMLTDGQFDSPSLKRHFIKETIPASILKGRLRTIARAMRTLPKMTEFGFVVPQQLPIWFPEELKSIVEKDGRFAVTQVDNTFLWGQTTAMRIESVSSH